MRVLLIEDENLAAANIEMVLRRADICVDRAESGEDGLELARYLDYDVAVLDLQLPDMCGLDVLKRMRAGGRRKPVLILSGDTAVERKVKALKDGADDYLTKPFDRTELVARIRGLVRRFHGYSHGAVRIGAVTVDLAARTVQTEGGALHLSDKEYQILELLFLRRGATVDRETFINHLYADGEGPDSNTIGLFVYKLRKKLAAANGGDALIETVRDRGYLLRRSA